MKIILFQNNSHKKGKIINKDLAGGFGTATHFGNSFLARLLFIAKKRNICLPSLTFGYLAAILKNQGHKVFYKEEIKEIKNPVDLIIILSSIVDYYSDIKAARDIKKRFGKNIKIGFVGPFSSVKPELFSGIADFVVRGEAEGFFIKNKNLKNLSGTLESSLLENLDNLPFPDWSIFPFKKYSYFPTLKAKPVLFILSSRGCSFPCGFYCPYPLIAGRKWRNRSVENVIEEIKYLKAQFKIKGLLFRDPIFTLNKERAAEIAKAIIKNKIKIEWACETRLDCLDEDLIDLLYSSGLRAFNVGIESVNEEGLKELKRNLNIPYQEKMIRYCHKKGIKISAFYILGLPNDTKEKIQATIKYAQHLNTNTAQFTICTPYPGTQFYEKVKDLIYETNWENFDAYTPTFKLKNISAKDLLQLKTKAHVNYYFRFKWLWKFLTKNLLS
jgi:radical SAM superfamily enzyme YgiQ (UPF0313 family)